MSRSIRFGTALAAFALFTTFSTVAAPAARAADKNIEVDLPNFESGNDLSEVSSEDIAPFDRVSRPNQVEITASSWVPVGLSLPSRVDGVSTFHSAGVPMFGAAIVSPVGEPGRAIELLFRSGISALRVERDGLSSYTGTLQRTTQNLFLVPIQLGIEARPKKLHWKALGLFGSASALPVLALTQRSAFDEGKTYFGLGGEMALGAESSLGWMGLGTSSLLIEAHSSLGVLNGDILRASGVRAGLRVQL